MRILKAQVYTLLLHYLGLRRWNKMTFEEEEEWEEGEEEEWEEEEW